MSSDGRGQGARSGGIFISYRRGETTGQARALHDRLAQRFGAARVFMDVDAIAPGADFVESIEQALDSSAVVLVLIGRDWIRQESGAPLLEQPEDFVALEVASALRLGVETIPILVERTTMPTSADLPEALQPLRRRNALELENSRWDYDVSRLLRRIEPLVEPDVPTNRVVNGSVNEVANGAGIEAPPVPAATETPEPATVRPDGVARRRRIRLSAALALLVAVVIGIVVAIGPSPPVPRRAVLLSAAGAVRNEHADRLGLALLKSRFSSSELPSGISASAPYLLNYSDRGLVVTSAVPMAGPATNLYVDYNVFDSPGDASAFFKNTNGVPAPYTPGASFSISGLGDRTSCVRGHASSGAPSVSACLVLSDRVVSFAVAEGPSKDATANDALVASLARDAVRHLARVTHATPSTAITPPPGSNDGAALFDDIVGQPFDPSLVPGQLGTPSVGQQGPYNFSGLFKSDRITFTFPAGGSNSYFIDYYVFDSPANAKNTYGANGLTPVNGVALANGPDSSGLQQPATCGTYNIPATQSAAAAVTSTCAVLFGDVIVFVVAADRSASRSANATLASTLARMAVFRLDELDGA